MAEAPNWKSRITFDPGQCGGRPCIRGMRVRVIDVIDLIAAGLSFDQILDELPYLEREDIDACLDYSRLALDHPAIEAA